jgi:hypothetical protein
MSSSEQELSDLYQGWNSDGLTWVAFGNSTQEDLNGLKNSWFPENPVRRTKVQDIWTRHPNRQG